MSSSFQLDPLIKIRENLRNQRRKDLAKAEADADFERIRLAEVEKRLEENLARQRTEVDSPSPSIETLTRLKEHRERLLRLKEETTERLTQREAEVESKRQLFEEAVRDVRVLENLKERRQNEESELEKKKEQKTLDDLRKHPGGGTL